MLELETLPGSVSLRKMLRQERVPKMERLRRGCHLHLEGEAADQLRPQTDPSPWSSAAGRLTAPGLERTQTAV